MRANTGEFNSFLDASCCILYVREEYLAFMLPPPLDRYEFDNRGSARILTASQGLLDSGQETWHSNNTCDIPPRGHQVPWS